MALSWSLLPPEILDLILQRLPLPDCFTFQNVCTSWRSVFFNRRRLTSPPPFMLLRPVRHSPDTGLLHCLHGGQFLKLRSPIPNLVPREMIVGSSMGWLVISCHPFVSITATCHRSYTPSLHLLNPISNERIPLPSFQPSSMYHVALSSAPTSRDCILVMSVCVDDRSKSYVWCRLGDCMWNFFTVHNSKDFTTRDMVFHKGKMYLTGSKGDFQVYTFDPQPMMIGSGSIARCNQVESDQRFSVDSGEWNDQRLVQSGGKLYFVGWHKEGLEVFKQEEELGRWVKMESLDDRVFLVGRRHTHESFCTQDLMGSGFEPNCIYFPLRRNEAMVKFSVANGTSETIHIPITDKKNHFLADVEWIVPQAWNTAVSGSVSNFNFPRISFWKPPPLDSVKVNFHSQIVNDCATYGIVTRNHLGHGVIYKYGRFSAANDLCAKVSALLFGMELASLLNFSRVMFECDDARLVTWLNYDEAQPPEIARGIVKSCKDLAAKFDKCSFDYIRMEGNEAAHVLTLLAGSDQYPMTERDVTCLLAPDAISNVICAELANL